MHKQNLELFVLTVRDGFITASQKRKSKVLLRSYFHIYDTLMDFMYWYCLNIN